MHFKINYLKTTLIDWRHSADNATKDLLCLMRFLYMITGCSKCKWVSHRQPNRSDRSSAFRMKVTDQPHVVLFMSLEFRFFLLMQFTYPVSGTY